MKKCKVLKSFLFFILTIVIFAGCSSSNESKLDSFKKAVEDDDAESLYDLVEVGEGIHWSAKHAQDVIDT